MNIQRRGMEACREQRVPSRKASSRGSLRDEYTPQVDKVRKGIKSRRDMGLRDQGKTRKKSRESHTDWCLGSGEWWDLEEGATGPWPWQALSAELKCFFQTKGRGYRILFIHRTL